MRLKMKTIFIWGIKIPPYNTWNLLIAEVVMTNMMTSMMARESHNYHFISIRSAIECVVRSTQLVWYWRRKWMSQERLRYTWYCYNSFANISAQVWLSICLQFLQNEGTCLTRRICFATSLRQKLEYEYWYSQIIFIHITTQPITMCWKCKSEQSL